MLCAAARFGGVRFRLAAEQTQELWGFSAFCSNVCKGGEVGFRLQEYSGDIMIPVTPMSTFCTCKMKDEEVPWRVH